MPMRFDHRCSSQNQKYACICSTIATSRRANPIVTGVVEGACRHLVRDRMELTGARWRLVGAEAVLKLRALRSSGDFDAYWDFHQSARVRTEPPPALR